MKNRMLAYLSISLLAIISFSSCGFNGCIEGDGILETKNRTIGNFTAIKSQGSWKVEVKKDTICHVEVIGESNILPYISTEIIDNELVIREYRNTCLRENVNLRLVVYAPNVHSITIEGSGDVMFDTLNSSQINLEIDGSGSMSGYVNTSNLISKVAGSGSYSLHGSSYYSRCTIDGSGSFSAFGLITDEMVVNISGSGNIKTYTTKKLNVTISGSGDVYYKGYPQISSNISGSGKVVNSN